MFFDSPITHILYHSNVTQQCDVFMDLFNSSSIPFLPRLSKVDGPINVLHQALTSSPKIAISVGR